MAVVILERVNSRATTIALDPAGTNLTLKFVALGSMDDIDIRAAVQFSAPVTYIGQFFRDYKIEHLGGGVWDVEVHYSPLTPKRPGESVYQFETAGGTQHITCSRATLRSYSWTPDLPDPPDYQGSIGVNGDNVEGVDIHLPVYTWSETRYIPFPLVTAAYKAILFRLTAKTNDAPFKGFAIGEVLFLGARGSARGGRIDDYWEINYSFASSENRTDVPVGNSGNTVTKGGWEYMWHRYADKVDPTARALVKVPVATYVERVYQDGDFSLLGIGV